MGQVLGIVYRCIATHLIKKAGFSCTAARTGAVTLIQRFGSALNLNLHLTCMDALMPRAQGCAAAAHMIFLDGVYVDAANGSSTRFRWLKAPTSTELTQLTHTIAHRVGRLDARHPWRAPCGRTACVQIRSWRICLERQGLLERDTENRYLSGEAREAGPLDELFGHSMMCREARMPRSAGMRWSGHVPHRGGAASLQIAPIETAVL